MNASGEWLSRQAENHKSPSVRVCLGNMDTSFHLCLQNGGIKQCDAEHLLVILFSQTNVCDKEITRFKKKKN